MFIFDRWLVSWSNCDHPGFWLMIYRGMMFWAITDIHKSIDEEDDNDEINVGDCDGDKDKSIDEENIFFLINLYNMNV